jgi:hypothetical protein
LSDHYGECKLDIIPVTDMPLSFAAIMLTKNSSYTSIIDRAIKRNFGKIQQIYELYYDKLCQSNTPRYDGTENNVRVPPLGIK